MWTGVWGNSVDERLFFFGGGYVVVEACSDLSEYTFVVVHISICHYLWGWLNFSHVLLFKMHPPQPFGLCEKVILMRSSRRKSLKRGCVKGTQVGFGKPVQLPVAMQFPAPVMLWFQPVAVARIPGF